MIAYWIQQVHIFAAISSALTKQFPAFLIESIHTIHGTGGYEFTNLMKNHEKHHHSNNCIVFSFFTHHILKINNYLFSPEFSNKFAISKIEPSTSESGTTASDILSQCLKLKFVIDVVITSLH